MKNKCPYRFVSTFSHISKPEKERRIYPNNLILLLDSATYVDSHLIFPQKIYSCHEKNDLHRPSLLIIG